LAGLAGDDESKGLSRQLRGSCPHQGKGYDEELFSIEKCMEWNFEDLKEQEKTGAEFYLMSI